MLTLATFLFVQVPLLAQEQPAAESDTPPGDSWTKVLKNRSQRGTLHDAFQKVRGDSGKWNDEPSLQHAPPINQKPPQMMLDDWADLLAEARFPAITSNDDNWLLFKTRQLDDNDRVWIERIERRGNRFTIVLSEAIWQGRYSKTFTFYNVFGVNLGKLAPGKYQAHWIIKPLAFSKFDGSGRPPDNWPQDDRSTDKKPTELSVSFTVFAASERSESTHE